MKTKVASLLVVILLTTIQCMAQRQITVEAQNNDISNNLDLKAVATAFGESQNLEEFEQKLNNYDSGISNLDLNNDGQVDYLRVIEKADNNVHVVVIQAVLDQDVYQDVATIVVEKNQNSNATVQIIGDPYLYGDNYIIEPAYYYTPSIFSFFWGANYFSWHSPYYWGYYPNYYHYRRPYELNMYLSNVYSHINHQHRYYYTNSIRDEHSMRLRNSISRNDYGTRYPDRNFSNRNENVRNKRDFEFNRNGVVRNGQSTRSAYPDNSNSSRPARSSYDNSTGTRSSQSNGWNQQRNSNTRVYSAPSDSRNSQNDNGWQNQRVNRNQNNTNTQTYTPPTNSRNSDRNIEVNRNNTYQQRTNPVNSNNNSINRNNGNSRQNTQTSSPRVVQPRNNTPSPVVKESRRDSKDNSSNNKNERR